MNRVTKIRSGKRQTAQGTEENATKDAPRYQFLAANRLSWLGKAFGE
jgi:hypothetical protein